MGRRGRKRQLDLESAYWLLLKKGVGTVAACQQVGITRKTGYRWRAENGGIPPLRLAEAARSSRYLSLLERQRIAALRGRGLGVRDIAGRIGRSPSTVSREIRRNLLAHDRDRYDGDLAHARARQRARRVRAAGSARTASCARRCSRGWSRSGARSRSRCTCGRRSRAAHPGMSATRRSTRRSITAARVA